MRFMGWGWDDLAECPADWVEVIVEMMTDRAGTAGLGDV